MRRDSRLRTLDCLRMVEGQTNGDLSSLGQEMHAWAVDLFPICRSLTGDGVRQTLAYLEARLPGLQVHSVPSSTAALDWTVPEEWRIRDAWVENSAGERVIDFRASNLHVVGYSEPVDRWLSRDELDKYLHSLPEQPDAIPYVTSYYRRQWGFCLTHRAREGLPDGDYRAVIDSELFPGVLNYGELLIPGESEREIFLSTYICHPSMANNELSGPVVTTALARWLLSLPKRRYSYRIVFIPETIGSLVYLSRNLPELKRRVLAGFNVTCVGDDRAYGYLPSRHGDTLADRAALHALRSTVEPYTEWTWLDRGSDERQYCAPGVDLPVCSIFRSKYGSYPEYHTSLDDLDLVTPGGLRGGFEALSRAMLALEMNFVPVAAVLGEPQLGKRGLYANLSQKGSGITGKLYLDLLTYSDGHHDLLGIAEILQVPIWDLYAAAVRLEREGLLSTRPAQGQDA